MAAVAALAVAGAGAARAANADEPAIHVGFALGPGWADSSGGSGRTGGGAGGVFVGRTWSGPWSWGLDSRFWWHSRDSTRRELTFAGAALVWHPGRTGPLARLAVGTAFDHRLLEFADASTDQRRDGFGVAAGAAWEFRLGTYFALGPEVDVTRMWLGHGSTAGFWSAALEATFYFPSLPVTK
jgi:hypothetical protein